jgi:hypothetical protein
VLHHKPQHLDPSRAHNKRFPKRKCAAGECRQKRVIFGKYQQNQRRINKN